MVLAQGMNDGLVSMNRRETCQPQAPECATLEVLDVMQARTFKANKWAARLVPVGATAMESNSGRARRVWHERGGWTLPSGGEMGTPGKWKKSRRRYVVP